MFLTGIGFLYITNSYYVADTVREMESIKNKIKDQKNIFVITKTQMSLNGQRNEVEGKVTELGLKESKNPPFQISLERIFIPDWRYRARSMVYRYNNVRSQHQ